MREADLHVNETDEEQQVDTLFFVPGVSMCGVPILVAYLTQVELTIGYVQADNQLHGTPFKTVFHHDFLFLFTAGSV